MTNSMQATLSKAAIYTKQPSRVWGDPYLTWGCANVLAKIVWDWEEQCFAAEYVWEFMSFCENCWERFCESCWERFCDSYWGSGIQVAEGVRVVEVLFTCWRCESFLLLLFFEYVPKQSTRVMGLRDLFIGNLIFTDTSQNRQNIMLLFFEYVPKQSTKVMGLRDLFIGNLICTYTS